MQKIETKEDLLRAIDELPYDICNEETKKGFIEGAIWIFEIKNNEINTMRSIIEKQKNKINEYCEKINDYDLTFYGIDFPKKGKKTKGKTVIKNNEFDVFSSIFNPKDELNSDVDDDEDSYYYE